MLTALALCLTSFLTISTVGASPVATAAPAADAAAKQARCTVVVVRTEAAAPRPCRSRTLSFSAGSRRMAAIQRELRLRPAKAHPMPRCDNYTLRIFENGSSAVTRCTLNTRQGPARSMLWWDWLTDSGFWTGFVSTAWKVTKCVASVTVAVVPLAKAGKYIKDLGGIRKSAELIVKAGSWSDLKKVAPGLAAEILGIAAIENNCF